MLKKAVIMNKTVRDQLVSNIQQSDFECREFFVARFRLMIGFRFGTLDAEKRVDKSKEDTVTGHVASICCTVLEIVA